MPTEQRRRVGVVDVVLYVVGESVAVKFVQSVFRPDPDVSVPVLPDAVGQAAHKLVGGVKPAAIGYGQQCGHHVCRHADERDGAHTVAYVLIES